MTPKKVWGAVGMFSSFRGLLSTGGMGLVRSRLKEQEETEVVNLCIAQVL